MTPGTASSSGERRPEGGDAPPVRVALTVTQLWHTVPGGSATSILDLARALTDRSEVRLAGVGASGTPTMAVPSDVALPVRSSRLPVSVLYDSWHRLGGRPGVEAPASSVLGHVDAVHLTVPMGPPRSSAPLVATVHDLFPLSRPDWFTRRGVRLMAPALERICERADAVVVPSESVAVECREHGVPAGRLHVVPWGSKLVTPPVDGGESVLRRFGLVGDYVLFVGTVEPRKGLAVLAEALAVLGRSDLTLVVVGPEGWGTDLERTLATVPGPVIRASHLAESDLVALRTRAGVCCVPSWAEGFGLPALEALAAGAPLVTSAGTALEEVAGDAAVLVAPGRADDLAAALRSVLDDDDLSAELRSAGPARAAEFTWQRAAAAYSDVYSEVVG